MFDSLSFEFSYLVEQRKHAWRNFRLTSSMHVIKCLCQFEWNGKLSFGAVNKSYRFCTPKTLHPTTQCEEQSQIVGIIWLSAIVASKHGRWVRWWCLVSLFRFSGRRCCFSNFHWERQELDITPQNGRHWGLFAHLQRLDGLLLVVNSVFLMKIYADNQALKTVPPQILMAIIEYVNLTSRKLQMGFRGYLEDIQKHRDRKMRLLLTITPTLFLPSTITTGRTNKIFLNSNWMLSMAS